MEPHETVAEDSAPAAPELSGSMRALASLGSEVSRVAHFCRAKDAQGPYYPLRSETEAHRWVRARWEDSRDLLDFLGGWRLHVSVSTPADMPHDAARRAWDDAGYLPGPDRTRIPAPPLSPAAFSPDFRSPDTWLARTCAGGALSDYLECQGVVPTPGRQAGGIINLYPEDMPDAGCTCEACENRRADLVGALLYLGGDRRTNECRATWREISLEEALRVAISGRMENPRLRYARETELRQGQALPRAILGALRRAPDVTPEEVARFERFFERMGQAWGAASSEWEVTISAAPSTFLRLGHFSNVDTSACYRFGSCNQHHKGALAQLTSAVVVLAYPNDSARPLGDAPRKGSPAIRMWGHVHPGRGIILTNGYGASEPTRAAIMGAVADKLFPGALRVTYPPSSHLSGDTDLYTNGDAREWALPGAHIPDPCEHRAPLVDCCAETCCDCGDHIRHDDGYHCERCGDPVCCDCVRSHMSGDGCYCGTCAAESLTECSSCNGLEWSDETVSCDECGVVLCRSCARETVSCDDCGNTHCEDCAEHFTTCADCGRSYCGACALDNTSTCADCGHAYCGQCADNLRECEDGECRCPECAPEEGEEV